MYFLHVDVFIVSNILHTYIVLKLFSDFYSFLFSNVSIEYFDIYFNFLPGRNFIFLINNI